MLVENANLLFDRKSEESGVISLLEGSMGPRKEAVLVSSGIGD